MADDSTASPALAALLASTRSAPLDPARQKGSPSSGAATPTPTPKRDGGPIPMSMPAILIQPKNKHLLGALGKASARDGVSASSPASRKGNKDHAGVPGGKRRRRRWENAQLAGNPHVHRPTRADFNPGPSLKHLSTTFAPPPANFSRSTYASPADSSTSSSAASTSLESGQFSMSLRGLRKNLRTSVVGQRVRRGDGGRTEEVLDIMERELQNWLAFQGRVAPGFYHDDHDDVSRSKLLDPTPLEDWQPPPPVSLPDEPARATSSPAALRAPPTLVELTRLPHTLVWLAPSPQHRFLLHSLARYYRLQSFSRPLNPLDPATRVTHILRPQLTRPAVIAVAASGFETPSATDWSSSAPTTEISASESEAEFTEGFATTDDDDDDGGDTTDGGESVQGAGGQRARGRTLLDELSGSEGESDYGADRELGFSTDDDNDEAYTGVDSLASSFADLSTSTATGGNGSAVPSNPTLIASAATPQKATPPFVPYTPSTPLAALPASLAISTPIPTAMVTRARGRRSFPTTTTSSGMGGRSSVESSPSRSPTRGAFVPPVSSAPGEWKAPERSFVDWVFE